MTTDQKVIKNKVGLLTLAQTLGNVSQACKVMGFSRDSFYLCFAKTPSGLYFQQLHQAARRS
jgi:hypothetical protein